MAKPMSRKTNANALGNRHYHLECAGRGQRRQRFPGSSVLSARFSVGWIVYKWALRTSTPSIDQSGVALGLLWRLVFCILPGQAA
ncbi:MAG: hypothetical protein ACPHL9_11975, partial [Limisphaerales bacterium]